MRTCVHACLRKDIFIPRGCANAREFSGFIARLPRSEIHRDNINDGSISIRDFAIDLFDGETMMRKNSFNNFHLQRHRDKRDDSRKKTASALLLAEQSSVYSRD